MAVVFSIVIGVRMSLMAGMSTASQYTTVDPTLGNGLILRVIQSITPSVKKHRSKSNVQLIDIYRCISPILKNWDEVVTTV